MAKDKARRHKAINSQYEDEAKIRKGLKDCMYLSNDYQKRFICLPKLKDFWNDHHLEDIAAFENYDRAVFPQIRKRFLRVLSIVIFIEWSDLRLFEAVFVKENLDDDSLFFDEHQLQSRGMVTGIDNFLTQQYIFKPEIIESKQQSYIQVIPARNRLPFLDTPEYIGRGGFGAVSKREIAPNCFEVHSDNTSSSNSHVVAVAVKEFPSNRSEEDFRREVGNLEFIKESLRNAHKCVMIHKAAIVHDQKFMILLPLAINYNLEVFLREGMQPGKSTANCEKKYDFSTKFPNLGVDGKLHKAVIKQVYQLADALLWLHSDITLFETQDRYLAHMDLKPENILIHGNPLNEETPAGTWTVCDFGISAFHKSSNKPIQGAPTIRDLTTKLTSRRPLSNAERGHGPYQPPEVALERKKEESSQELHHSQSLDNRKCDVWSFGGVLSDVLAFALGRSKGVQNLRTARFHEGDDNFYMFTVSPINANANITASNTRLKERIRSWGSELTQKYTESWVRGYVNVVFNASMLPCPADRKSMKDIRDDLGKLEPEAESVATEPLNRGLLVPPEPQPLDPPTPVIPYPPFTLRVEIPDNQGSPQTSSARSGIISAGYQRSQTNVEFSLRCTLPMPLRRGLKVKNTVFDLTGARIAILCQTAVYVFSTSDPITEEWHWDLLPGHSWDSVRLAYPLLALIGATGSGEVIAELYDLQTSRMMRNLDGAYQGDALSDISLSKYGIAACAYAKSASLYFPQSKTPYHLPVAARDATVSNIAFDTEGRKLFLWLEGCEGDCVSIFDTNHLRQTANECGRLCFSRERNLSNRNPSNLWPSTGSGFCIIYQDKGAFIAQAMSSHLQQQEVLQRHAFKTKNVVAGIVFNDDMLLCLEDYGKYLRQQLSAYSILSAQGGWRLNAERHPLGKLDERIDESAGMALHALGDRVELVLYTTKKNIVRYSRSKLGD
ncbi:MAG: hypothetical protein Q9214_002297 [Letrouitia sp. 1 TL-2023]